MIERRLMKRSIFFVLFFSSLILDAQPDLPPPPANPVPITGIEILVGAGALLGAKRMIANRKTNT